MPRSSQYFYQFCPDNVNQALVKVMGPSTITVQGYLQGATTSPANALATFPLSISSKQPDFVVGVSIKAKDPIDAYFKGEVEVSFWENGREGRGKVMICVCVLQCSSFLFSLPSSSPSGRRLPQS